MKVLIVDDHQLFSESFGLLLEKLLNVKQVDSVTSGQDALFLLNRRTFDIVFMDIHMPGLNGIETTQQIKEKYPKIKVIAISMLDDKHHILKMLKAGASGYFLKNTGMAELKEGMERIMSNEIYISKQVTEIVFSGNDVALKTNVDKFTAVIKLSDREIDIVKLVCKGFTSDKIAEELSIAKRTVDAHRANIYEKLGLRNMQELIKYALMNKLIKQSDSI